MAPMLVALVRHVRPCYRRDHDWAPSVRPRHGEVDGMPWHWLEAGARCRRCGLFRWQTIIAISTNESRGPNAG